MAKKEIGLLGLNDFHNDGLKGEDNLVIQIGWKLNFNLP